jgi:TadE-like protein
MTTPLLPSSPGGQAKSLPARLWRRIRDIGGERAQSVVEMALIMPVFIFLFAGVVEVADALNSYITVVDVSRDGARLGSKGQATDAQIKSMVSVEMGRLRDSFDSTRDMTIVHNPVSGDTSIKVQVCSNHSLILPGLAIFIANPLRMCSSTTMRTISYD